MALKAKRPCAEFGCNNLTTKFYCEKHQRNSHKYYNKSRDKKYDSFYKTSAWVRLRNVAFERDNGLCQQCLKKGILKRADVVHHIVEIREDWSKRLELNNLESLCHACHNQLHKGTPHPNFYKDNHL